MKAYTYLAIDFACIFVPLIVSIYHKKSFYKDWKFFFPANVIVASIFLIWDYFFTEAGIWGFNPDYLTGIYLANLPLEEVLFFICIPYACVFSFFASQHLIKNNPLVSIQTYISIFLVILLALVGLWYWERLYTSITFLSLALYLFYCLIQARDLSYAYLSYLAIVPFFLMSNGILTGSIIEAPIVWYNDMHNLGIRMFTIPVEDTFYGMLLIFLNIDLYTRFKKLNLQL